MIVTEYSWLTTDELIRHAQNSGRATSLELELSQRLFEAVDQEREQHDTGRQGQGTGSAAAH